MANLKHFTPSCYHGPPWYHQWGRPFPPAVPPVQIVINFTVYGGVQHFNSGSLQRASESSCCQETNDNKNEECRNSNGRVIDNMMKGSDCTADTAGCNNSSEEGDENKHEYSSDIVEDKSCDTHDNANNQEVLNSKGNGCTTGMQNEERKR
ncbi:hypothetical protein MHU86_24529 [Fragilaria crotonensis]|nr:hypothetical protein MHU86_24529 [Fragilaria crotonensis]